MAARHVIRERRAVLSLVQLAQIAAALIGLGLTSCAPVSGLETHARILGEPGCSDFYVTLSFAAGAVDLSPPAQAAIADAARHAAACQVAGVEALGLASDKEPADPSLDLSRRRAERLTAALTRAGLPAPTLRLSALGDSAVAVKAAGGTGRRRVDVFIRFQH